MRGGGCRDDEQQDHATQEHNHAGALAQEQYHAEDISDTAPTRARRCGNGEQKDHVDDISDSPTQEQDDVWDGGLQQDHTYDEAQEQDHASAPTQRQ
ncbi:hypothetical protein V6N13_001484 [Hibiscus sabdariffa]